MRKIRRILVGIVVGIAAVAALVTLSTRPTEARPPVGHCECANLDAPVICNGGKIYANPCVAACFKATGCVPYGR